MDPLQNPIVAIAVLVFVSSLILWSFDRSQNMTYESEPKQFSGCSTFGIVASAVVLSVFGTLVMLFVYTGAETATCSGTGTGGNGSAIICAQGDSIFNVFLLANLLIFPFAYLVFLRVTPRHWQQLFWLHIIFMAATIVFWVLPFLHVPLAPGNGY